MITLRPHEERGVENKEWLQSYHTFSFGDYYDPKYLNFHHLRVINEDFVQGKKGFKSHPHKDMEIITYVIEGVIEHQDSLGNTNIITPGEVQRMTAGTGIIHSEYNLSLQAPLHFLQIWITPNQNGLPPSYGQKMFTSASKWGQWCLMVSSNGRNGSLNIHQDADLYSTILDAHEEIQFESLNDRAYWIQIVSGKFIVQGLPMKAGDGAAIVEELLIVVKCLEEGEVLLFDLS